jgi:hypothetical protein
MTHEDFQQHCGVLQKVASQYTYDSSEYCSVELATKALLFIFMNGHVKAFTEQLKEYEQEDTRSPEEVVGESVRNLRRLETPGEPR